MRRHGLSCCYAFLHADTLPWRETPIGSGYHAPPGRKQPQRHPVRRALYRGASLALALLFEEYASVIHINDLSRPVYGFWTRFSIGLKSYASASNKRL